MDFTAIDFETANEYQTSACSIGIAVVENNRLVDTKHFLINPYPDYFHPFNVGIHGITKDDVAAAPDFAGLWPQIKHYLNGRIVAAHFAPFDMGVLMHTLDFYGVDRPEMDILCSCRLAKSAFPSLASHKLDNVCSYLNIPLHHHRADSDAAGSAQIICHILNDSGITELPQIREQFSLIPGYIRAGEYKPFRAASGSAQKDLKTYSADCPTPGFVEKDFVFSGTLKSMSRQKAFEVVSRGGGYPQNTIAQSTDYLVVGMKDIARSSSLKLSSKMRKALEMQKKGHAIRVLGEDEFIDMMGGELHRLCFEDEE